MNTNNWPKWFLCSCLMPLGSKTQIRAMVNAFWDKCDQIRASDNGGFSRRKKTFRTGQNGIYSIYAVVYSNSLYDRPFSVVSEI